MLLVSEGKSREIISYTKLYNSKCQNFRACGANQDMLYFFGRGRPRNRPPDHFNFVPGQQRSGYVSKSTPDRFNFVPGPQRSGYVSKFSNRPRTTPDRYPTNTGEKPGPQRSGVAVRDYPGPPPLWAVRVFGQTVRYRTAAVRVRHPYPLLPGQNDQRGGSCPSWD